MDVPADRIPADATRITPDMLPLRDLEPGRDRRDRVAGARRRGERAGHLPAGAAAGRDSFPPPDGGRRGDPYLLPQSLPSRIRRRSTAFVETLQQFIDRHDILRTSVVWEGLDEPVQVRRAASSASGRDGGARSGEGETSRSS